MSNVDLRKMRALDKSYCPSGMELWKTPEKKWYCVQYDENPSKFLNDILFVKSKREFKAKEWLSNICSVKERLPHDYIRKFGYAKNDGFAQDEVDCRLYMLPDDAYCPPGMIVAEKRYEPYKSTRKLYCVKPKVPKDNYSDKHSVQKVCNAAPRKLFENPILKGSCFQKVCRMNPSTFQSDQTLLNIEDLRRLGYRVGTDKSIDPCNHNIDKESVLRKETSNRKKNEDRAWQGYLDMQQILNPQ